MMATTTSSVPEMAEDFAGRGWRVVPIKIGARFPHLKEWPTHASTDLDVIRGWFGRTHVGCGLGIATGELSGFWVLDVDDHEGSINGFETLAALEARHGPLPETVTVRTGRNGLHCYFKWNPNRPIRNSQGAQDAMGGLDVRGDGGYVIAPPSTNFDGYRFVNHPDDVEMAFAPEWLHDALDAHKTPRVDVDTGTAIEVKPFDLALIGNRASIGDSPADWFRHNGPTFDVLLDAAGWTRSHADKGDTFWVRPGKEARDGHSAVLHGDGPLIVFSTDARMTGLWQIARGTGDVASLSKWDFYTATSHAGIQRDATTAIRGLMGANGHPIQPRSPETSEDGCPAVSQNLGGVFWDARPVLTHIRDAAHARGRSADAVLGNVLARVSAHTPHWAVLPAIVGSIASLNVIHGIVGPSGTGKSTAIDIARDVLTAPPQSPLKRLADAPLGSGEGLIEAYHSFVQVDGPDGKKERVKQQTEYAGLFITDEIDQLGAQASRQGSTLMATLRSAWSGGILGQSNATEERNRRLRGHSYRFCLIVGVQPEKAGGLLSDASGGTPQRFAWFSAVDQTIPPPGQRPDWPGSIAWTPPTMIAFGEMSEGGRRHGAIKVPDDIATAVAMNDHHRQVGERHADLGSSHRDLGRLKIAALLALLDERAEINGEDWMLAEMVADVSAAIYEGLEDVQRVAAAEAAQQVIERAVKRDRAVDLDRDEQAMKAALKSASQTLADLGEANRRQIRSRFSRMARECGVDRALAEGVSLGLYRSTPDGWILA